MYISSINQAWVAGAFEIIVMLAVAFIFGLLLGYLIWRKNNSHSDESTLKGEIQSLKNQNSQLENELAECKKKKGKIESYSSTPTDVSAKKDELKKVEGIGPKIQELLYDHQIYSFSQLANTSSDKLSEILGSAGSRMRLHDPTTWPQQAKLASEGKWDELKKWQDELKGGK